MAENTPYSEQELLSRLVNRDAEAFTQLFNQYKYRLFGFMHQLTGSVEQTEDIIQEVFFKLWKNPEALSNVDNVNAYIFRMAQNHAINVFKKMARETLALKELLNETRADAAADEQLSVKEIQILLNKAVLKLPPRQQQVFRLSRDEGLKHEEIAQRLNISAGTVKNHMIQALRRLREHIREHGDSSAAISAFVLIATAFEK